MKKLAIMTITATVAVLSMGSCGNKTEKVPFDNGDSAAIVNADPTLYGVCGDATSMNTLQLITDAGDTLFIELSAAQEAGKVFGGLQTGDRMAVLPNADKTQALIVVNEATLMGNWVMPNPLDGSDEVGISIKEGGIVEGIAQSSLTYKTWRLSRGRLELVSIREGGADDEEVNLYDIVTLGPDSLVIKQELRPEDRQLSSRDEDEIYRYGRQKAHEKYGKEIQLEDASQEDFMM